MAPRDDFGNELTAVVELALRMLVEAFQRADWTNRATLLRTMREPYRDIVAIFGEQSAWSAVRYLEQDRELAGVFARMPDPSESIVDPPNVDQIDNTLGRATNPRKGETDPDPAAVQAKLEGVMNRLVRQPANQTVWNATEAAGTRYARMPRGDAKTCPWCLMLASRGAVYSKGTVVDTTTRAANRPPGVSYHDDCRCVSVEVRTADDLPEINRRLEDLWIDHGGTFEQWQEYLAENPFGNNGS